MVKIGVGSMKKAKLNKKILIISLCILFLIINTIFILFTFVPKIELKGEQLVYVNINGEYKESG